MVIDSMGWAILWGFIIGGTSNSGGAGFLAFLVIWYFQDKSENAPRIINVLQQKINELESEKHEREWQRQVKDYEQTEF